VAETTEMAMPDEDPRELFMRVLDVERSVAELLVAHRITTLEEIAYVPHDELLAIQARPSDLIAYKR